MRKLFKLALVILLIFAQVQPAISYESNIVVVTPKGKKYHRMGYRTVRKSYRELTVEQARKRGYKPCKVCEPPEK